MRFSSRCRAAGINISEAVLRSGAPCTTCGQLTFPSGQGSDLAGVVAELGSGVSGFAVGDEVIGFSNRTVQPRRVRDRAGKPALRLWSGNQHEVWVAVTRCLRVQWKRIRRVELSRFLNPHPTRLTCFTSLL